MQYRTQIQDWLRAHESEMLRDLGELIAIPSVMGAPAENAPFGKAPAKALALMLEKCADYGFKTDNADNYAGCITLGDVPAKLGILAHLDVVPAG